jgi:PKD repeat protein
VAIEVVTLTFEGIANATEVGEFYNGAGPNDYGVSFTDALAIVDSDEGGTGNIANEPSPSTVILTLGTVFTMNVAAGFTGALGFFVCTPEQIATVNIWDGPNGTGTILATHVSSIMGTGGGGDPTGQFNIWAEEALTFAGTAYSVTFHGEEFGSYAFDNISLGVDMPVFAGLQTTVAPSHATGPNTVYGVLTGTGGFTPVNGIWDWGDGTPTSSGLTPSHTYAAPGTYTVSCSAVDAGAQEVTDTFEVNIGGVITLEGHIMVVDAVRGPAPFTLTANMTTGPGGGPDDNWGVMTPEEFLNIGANYDELLPHGEPFVHTITEDGVYYLVCNVGGDTTLHTTIYVGPDEVVAPEPVLQITPDAIRARGSNSHPVSLRYRDGTLQLWDHTEHAFVDLTDPPEGITVWRELPFEDLPPKAQEYVRLLSRIAYQREQGTGSGYLSQLQADASRLLRELQHEQTSTMRSNVANRPALQSKLQAIRTGGLYAQTRVPIR